MKLKKIIATICIVAMVMSVVTLPVMADAPLPGPFAINEEYGSGNTGEWTLSRGSGCTSCTIQPLAIDGDPGNYAMYYHDVWHGGWAAEKGDYVMHTFNDGAGIPYEEGKNIVIETRTNHMSGSANLSLKFNFSPDTTNETAWYQHMLWTFFDKGDSSNYFKFGATLYDYDDTPGTAEFANTDFSNTWFTTKIVIKGTSNKADITVKNDTTGEIASVTDLDLTSGANENNIDTAALKNLVLRSTKDTDEILVDYLRVYKTAPILSAVILVDVIAHDGSVQVKFNAGTDGIRDVSGAVDVYEVGGTLIPSTKTINTATGIVTLKPNTDLVQAGNYVVRIDNTKLRNLAEYTYAGPTDLSFSTYSCAATNVSVTGEVYSGGILRANFDFTSDTKQPGASTYKWQKAPSADGIWEDISGETSETLTIRNEYIENEMFIRFAVIPVASDGTYGAEAYSLPVAPPKKPEASYLRYNSNNPYTGLTLIANYDYTDYNGDLEKDTVVKWYIGNTADSCTTEVKTSKHIKLDNSFEGKYVKFTVTPKADSILNAEGLTVHSTPIGPIANILDATNMFVNPGLEDGAITPWFNLTGGSEGYRGMEITQEATYSGDYAARIYPKVNTSFDNWVQSVALEGGKRYIISAMVRNVSAASPPSEELRAYIWNTTSGWTLPYESAEMAAVNDTNWKRIFTTLDAQREGSFEYQIGFADFFNFGNEFYMDDFYCGPLLISDIGTLEQDPITIPTSGTIRLLVTTGQIYDQFGNSNKITGQTIELSTDAPGIVVDGNYVYITPQAIVGKADIKVSCDYTVNGVVQSEYVEYVELDLIANNDITPKALDVTATGVVANGNTLTGSYNFHQVEGKRNASVEKWMYADTENGNYQDIPGANGLTYTVEPAYADKFIKFVVIPKTEDGMTGVAVMSDVLAVATKPYAENIKVTGDFKVGGTVTASYDYVDINGDAEGVSAYQWYAKNDEGEFVAIDGATTKSFVLTEELTDKILKFAVTPKSTVAPTDGVEIFSAELMGPTAPRIENLAIKVDGTRLVAEYDYIHAHNARELDTIYSWKVDGREVSNKSSYVIDFNGIKSVTLTVIPVGDTIPAKGTPVSVSKSFMGFANNESSSGTGFGGTGGGTSSGAGGFAGGVTGIGNMDYGQNDEREKGDNENPPYNPNEVQDTPEIDISDYLDTELTGTSLDYHWGFPYIKPLITRGVMSAEEDGEYHPDKDVDREEMLTYLFKALNLETTEYKGTFDDVENGEFAQMLQTMVDNGTIAVDDNFRPGDTITREEMCKILYVSLDNAGVLKTFDTMVIEKFDDYNKVSDWAKEYVNAIYATKVMVGVSDTEFDPKGTVTKAQAAVMFLRILALTEKGAE